MIFEIGEIVFDDYKIDKFLGEGGHGEVYRVIDLQLGIFRALKVLKKRNATSSLLELAKIEFYKEARMTARLRSDSIIKVYRLIDNNEHLAMVMDYADGGDLFNLIQSERQLSPDSAIAIVYDIATGLAILHKKGIVHRDIKPENILFDENGHAIIGDLGIAIFEGKESQEDNLGTEPYESPEQRIGSSLTLTTSTDIFSLGLVLFEMITGEKFYNNNDYSVSIEDRLNIPRIQEACSARVIRLLTDMISPIENRKPDTGEKLKYRLRKDFIDIIDRFTIGEIIKRRDLLRNNDESIPAVDPELTIPHIQHVEIKIDANFPNETNKSQIFREKIINWILIILIMGIIAFIVIILRFPELIYSKQNSNEQPTLGAQGSTEIIPAFETSPIPDDTPVYLPTIEITKTIISNEKDGMELIWIEAGTYLIGAPPMDKDADEDEKPCHSRNIDGFWIDKFEVSNAQYLACVEAGFCDFPSKNNIGKIIYYGVKEFDNYPVVSITWSQADAYCKWVGRRLPTEAEWEIAARGHKGYIYPWGNEYPNDDLVVNYSGVKNFPWPVNEGSLGKSQSGVFNLAGNISEWVEDWYFPQFYIYANNENRDGPKVGAYKVIRGGSWMSKIIDLRASNREMEFPDFFSEDLGFRCAK